MDESWRELRELPERLRWARLHRTNFERPVDAARSLGIKPGTYRTYEQTKADGGRAPGLVVLQGIARKFGVSWSWVLTGQGSPDETAPSELRAVADALAMKLGDLEPMKKDDAIRAVEAVIASFARRA